MRRKRKIIIILGTIAIILVFCISCWKPLRLDRFYYCPIAIDWCDAVYVNDIDYQSDDSNSIVAKNKIGEEIGVVKFTLEGNVSNPNYKMRNWDATFLKVKTKLYQIKNEEDSIAALVDGVYHRYTARNS